MKQLVVSLIAVPGQRAAEAGRIHPGGEDPSRLDELLLERHGALEPFGRDRPAAARVDLLAHLHIARAHFRRHGIEHPRLLGRPVGDEWLVDRQRRCHRHASAAPSSGSPISPFRSCRSTVLLRPTTLTGQTSGCFDGSKSEAVSIPCSRLSIPSSTASRNETEQRCPVTLTPRLWASLIAAPSSARRMSVYALIQVTPSTGPVCHEPPRLLRCGYHVHAAAARGTGDVRRREVNPRARDLAPC